MDKYLWLAFICCVVVGGWGKIKYVWRHKIKNTQKINSMKIKWKTERYTSNKRKIRIANGINCS